MWNIFDQVHILESSWAHLVAEQQDLRTNDIRRRYLFDIIKRSDETLARLPSGKHSFKQVCFNSMIGICCNTCGLGSYVVNINAGVLFDTLSIDGRHFKLEELSACDDVIAIYTTVKIMTS